MSSERGERLGRRKITDRSWGKLASLLQIKSTRTSRSYTLCTANPRPQPLSLWEVFVARNYFWLGSSERGVIISTTVKRFFLSRRSKRESFSAFDQMSRVISLRAVFKRLVHSIARNCTDGFSHHLCKKKKKKMCILCKCQKWDFFFSANNQLDWWKRESSRWVLDQASACRTEALSTASVLCLPHFWLP